MSTEKHPSPPAKAEEQRWPNDGSQLPTDPVARMLIFMKNRRDVNRRGGFTAMADELDSEIAALDALAARVERAEKALAALDNLYKAGFWTTNDIPLSEQVALWDQAKAALATAPQPEPTNDGGRA